MHTFLKGGPKDLNKSSLGAVFELHCFICAVNSVRNINNINK